VSSEIPRPLPKASLTLLYFVSIAMLAQIWSRWVLVDLQQDVSIHDTEKHTGELLANDLKEQEKNTDSSLDHKVVNQDDLRFKIARGMNWAPKDVKQFLPKLFRPTSDIEEAPMEVEDIDDEILLSELQNWGGNSDLVIEEDLLEIDILEPSDQDESPNLSFNTVPTPDHKPESFDIKSNKNSEASSAHKLTQSDSTHITTVQQQESTSALKANDQTIPIKTNLMIIKSPNKQKDHQSTTAKDTVTKKIKPLKIQLISTKSVPVKTKKIKSKTHKKKRIKKRRTKGGVTLHSIEDPSANLRSFLLKLKRSKTLGRKVRVVHYGDSLIAGDYVTQTARRLLQKKFGDAGQGFFLAGKGSTWYRRQWVKIKTRGRWKKYKITKPSIKDHSYGLGGVTFQSYSSGSWVKATPSAKSGIGSKAGVFEVYYLASPKGGTFEVSFADQVMTVNSFDEVIQPKKIRLKAKKDGKHSGVVKVIEGQTRLFGLVLERTRGGVTYDSIGLEGVRAKQLLKHNHSHWRTQIQMRNPDLFVLHYGTNESEFANMKMSAYEQSLTKVIQRFKKAVPKAACLLVSPMDRARKDEDTGRIRSRYIVKKIVDSQRKVAMQQNCAFWSSYDAMGGWGSMARWYRARPQLAGGDLTHPTRLGANRIGAMFFAALIEAYQKYK
jgi:lysophospholipase L1-like esterase